LPSGRGSQHSASRAAAATITRSPARRIVCEEQYRLFLSTCSFNYFADPVVKNIVLPYVRYAGSAHYVKYWWFDKV
jgi:hypothetical protein